MSSPPQQSPSSQSPDPSPDIAGRGTVPGSIHLLDQLPNAFYVLRQGKVLHANPALRSLTGFDETELPFRLGPELVVQDDRPRLKQLLDSMPDPGQTLVEELRLRRADGAVIRVEFRVSRIEWDEQPAALCRLRDLSERRGPESARSLSAGLGQPVADGSPVGVIVVDLPAQLIQYVNPAALIIQGRSPEDYDPVGLSIEQYAEGSSFYDLNGEPLPVAELPLTKSVRTGVAEKSRLLMIEYENGMQQIQRVNIDFIHGGDPGGDPRAAIIHIEDVTAEMRARRELGRLQEELTRQQDRVKELEKQREAGEAETARLRRQLATIYEFAPVGFIDMRRDSMVLEANLSAFSILGRKRDHVVHRTLLSLVASRHRGLLAEHLQEVIRSEKPVSCEVEIEVTRGPRRFVRIESDRVEGGGREERVRSVLLDISQRMRAEIKLAQNEQRYRSIVESPLSIILVIDRNYQITFASQGFCSLLDHSYRELIGSDFRPFVAEHQRDMIVERYRRRQRGETVPSQYEMELVARDGSPRWIIANISLYSTPDVGVQTLVHAVDVTDRERTAATLRQQRNLLQNLFAQSADAVYVRRGDHFLMVNPRFEELFGYSSDELQAPDFDAYQLLIPEERRAYDKMLSDLVHHRVERPISTFTGVRKDGTTMQLQGSTSLIQWGEKAALLGVVRDMTDQRRFEQQVQQMQRLESLGRLAGGLAHDFNNMLTGIVGQAEHTRMQFDPSHPVHQDMLTLLDAAHSAGELTRRLLNFSRSSEHRPRRIELNDTLQQTRRMLDRILGKHVELELDLDDDLHPVFADPTQVEQIVVNLAVNAKDAMPEGGRLVIGTENASFPTVVPGEEDAYTPGPCVRLSVVDEGVGMSDDVLVHIFEPFFTTKREGEGTGLGLATVFGVVRQNGGTVRVRSKPGQGSRFDVYLPVSDTSSDSTEA